MEKDPLNKVDTQYTKMCLESNNHNCLTAYYHLMQKKMRVAGDISDQDHPQSAQLEPLGQ